MGRILEMGLTMFWGFSVGGLIATGIIAFLTVLGIIPRLANKAKIMNHYIAFGTSAILGIVIGSNLSIWQPLLPLPVWIIIIFGLGMGIFVGCLAVAVAEMIDVIPILKRRTKIKKGLYLFLIAFATGKFIGALYYWFYPGFLNV